MGTLKGFPNPPALWLRRAKPVFANAKLPLKVQGFLLRGARNEVIARLR